MRLVSDALVKRRGTARTKYLEEYFWICQVVLFSGITDRALTLHSTRHYWETALIHAGVQMELRHYITGNAAYLHMKWPVKVLKEAVAKVTF